MSAVPLSSSLAAALDSCDLPATDWLFPHGWQDGPVRPWTVSHQSNAYLHSIGITHTLHTLRHWFGTHTYRATGRDLRMTQELLRHRSPVSTAIYTFSDPGEAAAAVERLPTL
jgi:integrase/recombinase XerD